MIAHENTSNDAANSNQVNYYQAMMMSYLVGNILLVDTGKNIDMTTSTNEEVTMVVSVAHNYIGEVVAYAHVDYYIENNRKIYFAYGRNFENYETAY